MVTVTFFSPFFLYFVFSFPKMCDASLACVISGTRDIVCLTLTPYIYPTCSVHSITHELLSLSRPVCFVQTSASLGLGLPPCLEESILLHTKTI